MLYHDAQSQPNGWLKAFIQSGDYQQQHSTNGTCNDSICLPIRRAYYWLHRHWECTNEEKWFFCVSYPTWTIDLYHETDLLIYLPHSVAFCNGHSDAVAINPWRRFNTRVLWSSPLQQGTIVPWVNGVVFVSLFPISVPKFDKNRNKTNSNHEKKWNNITLCVRWYT